MRTALGRKVIFYGGGFARTKRKKKLSFFIGKNILSMREELPLICFLRGPQWSKTGTSERVEPQNAFSERPANLRFSRLQKKGLKISRKIHSGVGLLRRRILILQLRDPRKHKRPGRRQYGHGGTSTILGGSPNT